MENKVIEALKTRRTIYSLGNKIPVSDVRIEEILAQAVTHVPSAFNSQSSRVVLLLGAKHDAFWDSLKEVLRSIVPAEAFPQSEAKVNGFKAGHGTVLFFEDQAVVEVLQAQFPAFAANFPVWSGNSTGMLQFAVWTAFATEGVGASLQHYHPLVDAWVYENLNVPASWRLTAQMPFGEILAPAGEKAFAPIAERFRVAG